jgi:undecaprenyl-diphosphatase
MTILNAVILGLVEGITEFLPISSTAHLIFTSKILQIPHSDLQKFFEVFIQSGAILAVIFLYLQYVRDNKLIVKRALVSFIPTAIVGFLFYTIIKKVFFETNYLIITSLVIIGIIFFLVEFLISRKKLRLTRSLNQINYPQAILIGLSQTLAVIPGVSRSGIVIATMMLMGYKREESAQYSFLLAVPTILMASLYDFYKMRQTIVFTADNFIFLGVGFLVSFLTAYLTMKWLIGYLKQNSLIIFAVYRLLLAIILVLVFR